MPPRATAAGSAPVEPGRVPYHGDLAVLELTGAAPEGAEPAPFLQHSYANETIALWASGNPLPTVAVPRVSAPPWIALDALVAPRSPRASAAGRCGTASGRPWSAWSRPCPPRPRRGRTREPADDDVRHQRPGHRGRTPHSPALGGAHRPARGPAAAHRAGARTEGPRGGPGLRGAARRPARPALGGPGGRPGTAGRPGGERPPRHSRTPRPGTGPRAAGRRPLRPAPPARPLRGPRGLGATAPRRPAPVCPPRRVSDHPPAPRPLRPVGALHPYGPPHPPGARPAARPGAARRHRPGRRT